MFSNREKQLCHDFLCSCSCLLVSHFRNVNSQAGAAAACPTVPDVFCSGLATGLYSNPCDGTCGTYLQCDSGRGWLQSCSAGLRFNPVNQVGMMP